MSIAWDITGGAAVHDCFTPPTPVSPPLPAIGPALEMPCPMFSPWFFGHKIESTVRARYAIGGVVQKGHDLGKLIPDLVFPPMIPNLPKHIFKSKRKPIFDVYSVKVGGKEAAAPVGMLLPMNTCGKPFALPTATNVTCIGAELMNFSVNDLINGFLHLVAEILVETLFKVLWPGGSSGSPFHQLFGIPTSVEGLIREAAKKAVQSCLDAAIDSSMDRDVKLKTQLGPVGLQTKRAENGDISYKASVLGVEVKLGSDGEWGLDAPAWETQGMERGATAEGVWNLGERVLGPLL